MQFGINSIGAESLPVGAGRAPLCESAVGYINLDHAATTPAFSVVKRAVAAVLPYYGAVHRGSGFKSGVSTELYQRCRKEVLEFLGVYEGGGRSVRATAKHFGRDRKQIYRWLELFGVARPAGDEEA